MAKLSPMMTYYLSLKEEYKDEIVLFRLGDFYEMFFDDAIKASRILDLTLTGRDCGLDERAPMCGMPYHAAENYIARLVAAGEKVAVCEQLSDPKTSKGMVDRGVVRVITPGTLIDDYVLDSSKSNYLAVIAAHEDKFALTWCDISTGEFNGIETDKNDIKSIDDMLCAIVPSELITDNITYNEIKELSIFKYDKIKRPTIEESFNFKLNNCISTLLKQFNVSSLESYEINNKDAIIIAGGALIAYVNRTQKRSLSHISAIKLMNKNSFLFMDSNTRRNLEITQSSRDGKKYGSLLWVLDKTSTSMGARLMSKWLEQPLINYKLINYRLDSVEQLLNNNLLRSAIKEKLKNFGDLERICGRFAYRTPYPRDLLALRESLKSIPSFKTVLADVSTEYLIKLLREITPEDELSELLSAAINDKIPTFARDGGVIKDGFNPQLDELRLAKITMHGKLAAIEQRERENTQIKLLKVEYNKVHGFYIEVPKSSADKVPYHYSRKQTLLNCERYITQELKELEDIVLNSEANALELELKILEEIENSVRINITSILITAQAIAAMDCLVAFAEVARENDYCKPTVSNSIDTIVIENGRHPVVEKIIGRNAYTSNSTLLDSDESRTMLITGPNMSGKSTYMRTVAAITLMAHCGSYVPAKSAEISITDRIFTRVGASDDLVTGQSTFMVEMVEVATILRNATDKSLIILDEIGRGTSTCDGLAIAWAVMEYITSNYKCKTLFSTHYHELTVLEGVLKGVKNYRIMVTELHNQVVFTHKIARGGANKSYGIEVAKIAGLPIDVTTRANIVADKFSNMTANIDTNALFVDAMSKENTKQLNFLSLSINEEIIDRLKNLSTDDITPMQALMELNDLKEKAKKLS